MEKKLLFILLLSVCGITYTQAQEGEIFHTVFEPDTVTWTTGSTGSEWIRFDMDRDGIDEWRFQGWDWGHQAVGVKLLPNIHPFGDTLELYARLRITSYLYFGDTISNYENWTGTEYNLFIHEGSGAFPNQYVSMRYLAEDGYRYGWINFSVEFYEPAPDYGPFFVDVVLHEMAYCTIPNYPLLVGQTSLYDGFGENEATAFAKVYPNPSYSTVTVTGKDLRQAEVINMLGQHVATARGKGETLQIDITDLPAGIYFVNITDSEGRKCVKKVVKE